MTAFRIKRVYEPPSDHDGARVLVDRLWPRGVAKAQARIDLWLKDIAPSNDLRRRFHGHSEDWDQFETAYAAELRSAAAQAAAAQLFDLAKASPVTLLYAARDEARNNAVALLHWLDRNGAALRP